MKHRKWFMLMPATVAILLLIVGYYLDARAIKIIGAIIAALVLLLLA